MLQVVSVHTETEISIYTIMFCLLIPLVVMVYIKNLKLLAPLSSIANILTFTGLAIMLYYIFKDLKPLNARDLSKDVPSVALFFGTALFALEAVGVVSTKKSKISYI